MIDGRLVDEHPELENVMGHANRNYCKQTGAPASARLHERGCARKPPESHSERLDGQCDVRNASALDRRSAVNVARMFGAGPYPFGDNAHRAFLNRW